MVLKVKEWEPLEVERTEPHRVDLADKSLVLSQVQQRERPIIIISVHIPDITLVVGREDVPVRIVHQRVTAAERHGFPRLRRIQTERY
jgi:hypothetical protein